MQKKKTGKLFEFCCLAPAIISNKKKIKKEMSFIGEELGFLFQIADDLLDIKGDKTYVGKLLIKIKKR